MLQRVSGLCGDARRLATRRAAHLSLEHGALARILFAAGAPNAACALLRSQYEAALLGAWAVYAAAPASIATGIPPTLLVGAPFVGNLR